MKSNLLEFFFFLNLVLALTSCDLVVESDPKTTFLNDNMLMPTLKFSTPKQDSVLIKFWSKADKSDSRISPLSIGTHHTITLLNLTEQTKYDYNIISLTSKDTSDTFSFETGEVSDSLISIKKDILDTTSFDGYILIRRFFQKGADFILNNRAEVVWYNSYPTEVRRAFSIDQNNIITSIIDTSKIEMHDLYGNQIKTIDFEKSGNPLFVHHEVMSVKDKILAISTDSMRVNLESIGRGKDQLVIGPGIILANLDGSIDWRWSIFDHSPIEKLIQQDSHSAPYSVAHANAITISADGNYLISFRDLSQIWKIDSQTGAVLWKLGKDGDFEMDEDSYFIGQHSIHIDSKGEIIMFDNGSAKERPNSRIVQLKIDEKNKKVLNSTIITLPKSLSSYRMGSAYLIEEDKYLVCVTRKDCTLAIVDGKANILWKVVVDNASYRAYYLSNPFEN